MLSTIARYVPAALLTAAALLPSCQSQDGAAKNAGAESNTAALFEALSSEQTGIAFVNSIKEDEKINYFNYGYIYNGGGVAVGDIDGDGLPDLYFSATMGANKLYRNLGDFRFEDITEKAGVTAAEGFKTGVLMADVNSDGLLDLYVCRTGNGPVEERSNLLFINQGGGVFKEQSAAFGLDAPANTNHAVFFDYDQDGDLDCYWLNHPIRFGTNSRPRLQGGVRNTAPETLYESDRLFRNDGGRFTDVTVQAGVVNSAFGLSVSVHDYNGDGLPDLFV
ncbi:MAG: RNA-binding protein, partial [Bacteroidetes bacterium]|nr:RNA-binding protein [Bacteroidota bacterium]